MNEFVNLISNVDFFNFTINLKFSFVEYFQKKKIILLIETRSNRNEKRIEKFKEKTKVGKKRR